MTLAIDYSFSRPDPHAIKASGVSGVMRYLGHTSAGLTAAEAKTLIGLGLWVGLNYEGAANGPKRGAGQGQADALFANTYSDQIGAPRSAVIFYSIDTSATYDEVVAYYRAAKAVGIRPVGFYGPMSVGLRLQAEGVVSAVWVTNAASWSGFTSWDALAPAARGSAAHLLQHLDHPLAGLVPGSYDLNEVLRPFPTWGGTARPLVIPQEDEVSIICSRVPSTVPGREPFVTFDPATKTFVGFNGADFVSADPKSWKVTHWPKNAKGVTGSAQLLVAASAPLSAAELPDGSGVVVTAAGDGGTFEVQYAKVKAAPAGAPVPVPVVDYAKLAAHLKVVPQ